MKKIISYLIIIGFMVLYQTPIIAQNSEKLFEQGMMKEEGEGNLIEAIEIYNSVVTNVSAERKLRAKSLLQVGICYEKLGNQNARKSYQKLISEYSDQKDIVALGREKLNGLKKLNPVSKNVGIVASQVWIQSQDIGGVSPDGRYINYIDWNNISTNIKDLHTGKTIALTNTGTWKGTYIYPDRSIISSDSKRLVYFWYNGDVSELHIINVDGSSDKIIAKGGYGNNIADATAPWPVAWSPDGKHILSIIFEGRVKNKMSKKLVLVSANDGSIKVLKSYNISNTGNMDISPDNKYIVYAQLQNENSQQNDIYVLSMDGSMDKKIVKNLANDKNPLWSPDGKGIIFWSDRNGTAGLWKLKVENGNPIGIAEQVEANLGDDFRLFDVTTNKSVYYIPYNHRNDVYIVNLDNNSGKGTWQRDKISKLSDKINLNPILSSDGRYVAYLRRPKARIEGLGYQYLFTIFDTKTGDSRNLDTEIYGNPNRSQHQWSPDGTKILFNGVYKNSLKRGLYLFDISTGEYTTIKTSNIDSRLRSATFSNDGKSIFFMPPDGKSIFKIDIDSKKETIVFSDKDAIWRFNLSNDNSKIAFDYTFDNYRELYIVSTSGGEKKKILESRSDDSPTVISWSKDDKYLYYKEGKDRYLKKLMRVSVDGGDPEQVLVFKDIFENGKVSSVNMLPDGQHLVLQLGVGSGGDVWKLDGIFDE